MAADADRHLLFGLLALQNGLIQQAQLVSAFHAWTCDKRRPLADHLLALGHLNAAQRSAIEALSALHVERHGGDPEKSLAALGAGRSTREGLAGLGDPDVNNTLGHVGSGSTEADGDGSGLTMMPSVGTTTSSGLRFRVLRPHARGGLGAVFVALDSELNREVALKEILDSHADDPGSRQRFLLEAEITGGLEHPGIVPVYGMGTYGGGRPYYAMRLVKGDSLRDAVARFHDDATLKADPGRRSLELRSLLRRFIDVCNAIEYAHSRGVLHRDIKPGNIIVGRHGETLVVDWGLAKVVGQADPDPTADERTLKPGSAGGSAETLPGSALGTPAYMSPEQARGDLDALGPRSDVYSLGATLYSLLTGKTPFEGNDVGDVLRRVRTGEFPPPRSLDPAIDRALEAVCLKAMAVEPAARYGSPRALADDVERWAADEPVTAHPESLRSRLGRWGRRHRAWVQAGAAALALVVVFAVLFAVERNHSADRLGREQKTKAALNAERHQRAKAETQAHLAQRLASEQSLLADRLGREKSKTAAALAAETEQRTKAEAQTKLANNRLYLANMNSAQRFWDAYNPALFLQFLSDQRAENQQDGIDRRGFEWHYWVRKFSAGHRTLKGHTAGVAGVAFSPDGKRIASASGDRTVKVWDAATGQEALTLRGHTDALQSVAFSPDGNRIASASWDRTVKVWDAATGQEALTLRGHTDALQSVAFSPDGNRIASASWDRTVKVWDAATGQEALTLRGHTSSVAGVAFSPDGNRIASASLDHTVKVWDAATGQEALTLKGHTSSVAGVAFSPDGNRIASASLDHTVKVWDAATGQEALTLRGHTEPVNGVAFSPDGKRIASASGDKTVKVWDAATGQEALTLKGHAEAVYSVAFSPDGDRLASASGDKTVKVWDAATGQEALTLKGHAELVTSVAFSPDGKRLASASADSTVKVWDARPLDPAERDRARP